MDTDIQGKIIATLLASGFPFQTAVVKLINNTPNWRVYTEEYPWVDDNGVNRFLDIVAVSADNHFLTIECKKTEKDIFTFLVPKPSKLDELDTRCLYMFKLNKNDFGLFLFCGEWEHLPRSAVSSYCVVSGAGNQRMLEGDCQLLIKGTDAFAKRYQERYSRADEEPLYGFIPLLVTNATLAIAEYDPSDISLETGKIDEKKTTITSVEWIRFVKAFTAGNRKDLGSRTIFVVSAKSLQKFVLELQANTSMPPRKAEIII